MIERTQKAETAEKQRRASCHAVRQLRSLTHKLISLYFFCIIIYHSIVCVSRFTYVNFCHTDVNADASRPDQSTKFCVSLLTIESYHWPQR